MLRVDHALIIGGGFSGTLLAVNLLRHGALRITLVERDADRLLAQAHARGDIRPDPLSIGIDVDRQCRAIAGDGSAQQRLFVVGPMTRGAHWEIVAVPDIGRQVWSLAREITGARSVEAEGL